MTSQIPTDEQLLAEASKPGATFAKVWRAFPDMQRESLTAADKRLGLGLQRTPAGKRFTPSGVPQPKSELPKIGRERGKAAAKKEGGDA